MIWQWFPISQFLTLVIFIQYSLIFEGILVVLFDSWIDSGRKLIRTVLMPLLFSYCLVFQLASNSPWDPTVLIRLVEVNKLFDGVALYLTDMMLFAAFGLYMVCCILLRVGPLLNLRSAK